MLVSQSPEPVFGKTKQNKTRQGMVIGAANLIIVEERQVDPWGSLPRHSDSC